MPRGGYRKPANPAAVSGPGAHSQRTDGQPTMDLPDAQYGEASDYRDISSSAPLASAQGQGQATSAPQGQPMPSFTSMGAPTQQPSTPVTDGADYGAGANSSAITPLSDQQLDAQYLQKYLPTLINIAESDDTPPGTKRWVRSIIANR